MSVDELLPYLKENKQGVPQGGPLSPLLANVMLNELDKELERRGHKFVRRCTKWQTAAKVYGEPR